MRTLLLGLWWALLAPIAFAHPSIDGTWRVIRDGKPDPSSTVMFKVSGPRVSMSSPNGSGYEAVVDGPEVPHRGEPGVTVSVKMPGPAVLVETSHKQGKPWLTFRFEVAADGKTGKVTWQNHSSGKGDTYLMQRQ